MADGLTDYLNRIGRIPLLTPADEIRLGTIVRRWLDHPEPAPFAVERRGRRARERMVAANLRLAVRFAARFKGLRDLDFEDLIQAANLGLIRAVEKFDPARGYRFSTYAYWWIRQSTTRFIERQGVAVSMPGSDAERLARLAPVRCKLSAKLGREPTLAEVGEVLGIGVDRLVALIGCNSRCLSLDAPAPSTDGEGATLGATLEAPREAEEGARVPEEVLGRLPPLHRRLVVAAAGVEGPPQSAAAIAKAEGMGEAQVRRLLGAAGRMAASPVRRRRARPSSGAGPGAAPQPRAPSTGARPSAPASKAAPLRAPVRPAASPGLRRLPPGVR